MMPRAKQEQESISYDISELRVILWTNLLWFLYRETICLSGVFSKLLND